MKKYLLLIFLFVVCFHDGINAGNQLDPKVTCNSIDYSSHLSIDDMLAEVKYDKSKPASPLLLTAELRPIFQDENIFQIWKPPVNF